MEYSRAEELLSKDYEFNSNFSDLKCMNIIAKYTNDMFEVGHDQIWIGDFNESIKEMQEEELIQLAKHGWFEDEDSWSTMK